MCECLNRRYGPTEGDGACNDESELPVHYIGYSTDHCLTSDNTVPPPEAVFQRVFNKAMRFRCTSDWEGK